MHIYTEHTLTHLLSRHPLKVIVCECPSAQVRVCLKVTSREVDHLYMRRTGCRIDIENTWTCGQTSIINCFQGKKINKQHKQASVPITSKSHSSVLFRTCNRSFALAEPSTHESRPDGEKRKGKICYLALSTFAIQIIAAQYFSKKSLIPSSFGCPILMKIQFSSFFSLLPPQLVLFSPTQSD